MTLSDEKHKFKYLYHLYNLVTNDINEIHYLLQRYIKIVINIIFYTF